MVMFHYSLSFAQPSIVATPPQSAPLYADCGNIILIEIPALEDKYNPSFITTGASVIKTGKKGEVIVVPNGATKEVEVMVFSDGKTQGALHYKVFPPPLPSIQIKIDTTILIPNQTVEVNPSTAFRFEVIADPEFKKQYPKDSRYILAEWTYIIIRNNKVILCQTFSGVNEVAVSTLKKVPKSGDHISFQNKVIKRANFQGRTFDIAMPPKVIAFTVK